MTRYTQDVLEHVARIGHATNSELLGHLNASYPELSATTVHRITARLVERGTLAIAPVASGGVMRFDANTTEHDHFHCSSCDMLRDTTIADKIRPVLEQSIGEGCRITGSLVISGLCKNCNNEE